MILVEVIRGNMNRMIVEFGPLVSPFRTPVGRVAVPIVSLMIWLRGRDARICGGNAKRQAARASSAVAEALWEGYRRPMNDRFDLLVIDLDGTLMTSRGEVSQRNRDAIDAVWQAGVRVIVATGRALVESLSPLEAIGHEGIVIGAGGAIMSDARTGRTVSRDAMPPDLVKDVTDALLKHGHKVLILKDPDESGYDYLAVGPGELDPASRWWFETLPVRVRFVHELDDDPHPMANVRVGAVATEEELAPIARQLKAEISERGFLQHWSAVTESAATNSATHLLEVFNPHVNKWTMLTEYCRQNNIDTRRVVAIGDGINDVQIVGNAGLGIAMGNADDPVREVADLVTGYNDDDGVAEAIERLLDGRW